MKTKKEHQESLELNTSLNQINISNHGFESGDTVTYSGNASGLSSVIKHILLLLLTLIDFKLSSVGVGTTAKLFYYNTNQYVDIESVDRNSYI